MDNGYRYIDASISNEIADLNKKVDKLFYLIDDIKNDKQPENLMKWRVAALKKLERTQKNINLLINTIENFEKGLLVKEHIDGALSLFSTEMPTTLKEYEQSHALHLRYIIQHLINIRDNIFKE